MSKLFTAAILGGSGSVGKCVVNSLLKDSACKSVMVVSRRPLDDIKTMDPDRVNVVVCDPIDDMSQLNMEGTNVAFCTLGVGSPRKVSKEELMRVDAEIPTAFAKRCADGGVTHYCLLSAAGANENSKWSSVTKTAAGGGWYNHVKGVVERQTTEAGMQYVLIAQPGALLGSPHTPGFMDYVPNFILPSKYSSARIDSIAEGMVNATVNAFKKKTAGVVVITGGTPLSNAT